MNFVEELNENQYKAVTSNSQHLRIIAGAGSGKTRVLTYRIAYLLDEYKVRPWEILAFTFTNKVAKEMRDRVFNLLDYDLKDLTIKTFHSFAALFLRREIHNIGFPTNFTILDEEDQTTLIKDIVSQRGYKRKDPIVKETLAYISRRKLEEKYPDDIEINVPLFPDEKECLEIYRIYEEQKNKMYNLDFDDLLLKTNYILENFLDVRERWRHKFRYILIDEFQDTNNTEYKMIRNLINQDTSLYVVGDPDQTIYTWRGANQNIIIDLEKNYPDIETIVLDRNYRSTQMILDAANLLISHNRKRIPKNLYTVNSGGHPVSVKSLYTNFNEADYVVSQIETLVKHYGYSYKDIAILYRANYITLEFERVFAKKQIPYNIYGGMKFYQRREIKDVLAYFHLLVNEKDDVSFIRIVNIPRRGVGEQSLEILRSEAYKHELSLYEYICDEKFDESELSTRNINSLKSLAKRMEYTKEKIESKEENFSKILEELIFEIGYMDYLDKEDDGEERRENVEALFDDIRHFMSENPNSSFDEYLQNVTLFSAQDEVEDTNRVSLMTVHVAKGLEFPVVFIVRFNDAVFPHLRSLEDGGYLALEEERRLAYVAMTRAKERLYISFSSEFNHSVGSSLLPSRFIKEAGLIYLKEEKKDYSPFRSNKKENHYIFNDGKNQGFESQTFKQNFEVKNNGVEHWDVGDIVIHTKLGRGVVIAVESDDIIKVKFDEHGIKLLSSKHPALSKGGFEA